MRGQERIVGVYCQKHPRRVLLFLPLRSSLWSGQNRFVNDRDDVFPSGVPRSYNVNALKTPCWKPPATSDGLLMGLPEYIGRSLVTLVVTLTPKLPRINGNPASSWCIHDARSR